MSMHAPHATPAAPTSLALPTDGADALDATDAALAALSPDERRTRLRLRELCDEVIASRRVREGEEPIPPDEREEARALLRQFTPRIGQRERVR